MYSVYKKLKRISAKAQSHFYKFVILGFILSFSVSLSICPIFQVKSSQNNLKSDKYGFLKSFQCTGEYNLDHFIYSQENSTHVVFGETNKDAYFLSFVVPFLSVFLNYFKSAQFIYNFISYFNHNLHNLPPPFTFLA